MNNIQQDSKQFSKELELGQPEQNPLLKELSESNKRLLETMENLNSRLSNMETEQKLSHQRAKQSEINYHQAQKLENQKNFENRHSRFKNDDYRENRRKRQRYYSSDEENHSSDDGKSEKIFTPHRRSESRSPSPAPRNNSCFACFEDGHWTISCPYLTDWEREHELFKVTSRLKKQNVKPDQLIQKEKDLRTKYNLPFKGRNQCFKNDFSKKAKGRGPYCKWEHKYEHHTFLCPNYCPLCHTSGHGWQNCNFHTQKVKERNEKFTGLIKKLETDSGNP